MPTKAKKQGKAAVKPNLYISYSTTNRNVVMVTRVVSTGDKDVYDNGTSLSYHLSDGTQTIVLKIGKKNYNRNIVIPTNGTPVHIFASYDGRAHITIEQPQSDLKALSASEQEKSKYKRTGKPNLYISYSTTNQDVGMVSRIVSTGEKETYKNGQTLSFCLNSGPQQIVLKIGRKNYARNITIPSNNAPVRIHGAYNGRAQITIEQPTIDSNDNAISKKEKASNKASAYTDTNLVEITSSNETPTATNSKKNCEPVLTLYSCNETIDQYDQSITITETDLKGKVMFRSNYYSSWKVDTYVENANGNSIAKIRKNYLSTHHYHSVTMANGTKFQLSFPLINTSWVDPVNIKIKGLNWKIKSKEGFERNFKIVDKRGNLIAVIRKKMRSLHSECAIDVYKQEFTDTIVAIFVAFQHMRRDQSIARKKYLIHHG